MTEYFKSLRRKIGVVTLVIACVFAAGWVRSFFKEDIVEFSDFVGQLLADCPVAGIRSHDQYISLFSHVMVQAQLATGGFVTMIQLVPRLVVPYWSIVIPLTLLSAGPLLSKSRTGKTVE